MTFSKEIIEILDYLGKQFGIAIDWSSKNVMPYLQDLMSRFVGFKMTKSGIWIAIMILIIVPVGIFLLIKGNKTYKRYSSGDDYYADITAIFLWIGSAILLVTAICVIGENIFNMAECHFLPEKVIYEYIQTLLPK